MKVLSLGLILSALSLFLSAAKACTPEADSSAGVLHCKVSLNSYPRPVHFYIPNVADGNFAVHFHGHNLDGWNHFDKRYGDYGQYLQNSKAKFALIIPESLGNCATYDQFFADKTRTEKFFGEVEEVLKKETNLEGLAVALSGHSGAYRVLNKIFGYESTISSVKAVGLFDAVYGDVSNVSRWVEKHSDENILFLSAYVSSDKGTTEDGNLKLRNELKNELSGNINFVPVEGVKSESLLEQHFMILKRGSLEVFFSKASAIE